MKKNVPESYHSVFLALRDAAMFPTIRKEFEDNDCFKNSLLRDNAPKQFLDSARYILNGIDVKSYYKFSYSFLPPYCSDDKNNTAILDFDFKYGTQFDQRIYALIGKNGTGKTTLLSQMANDFANAESNQIIPQKPIYNKVITISFSFFDKLPLPSTNALFNYSYLGLKNNQGDDANHLLEKKLRESLISINNKNRYLRWNSIIKRLFHDDIYELLITTHDAPTYFWENIDVEKVTEAYKCFSSGENLLIYIISSLVSEINNNTLILFDEPETHLHPNAISILMNALYLLLNDFNSFCILATHSPLVIQEISSSNIIVLKREGNNFDVQKVGYETFAENITTITNEIFGNREVAQYHTDIMKHILNENSDKSYEEILSIIQNNDIPTPLNVKLFIKELIRK
jgi:ABC-type multidrug transport system ATPase subunit